MKHIIHHVHHHLKQHHQKYLFGIFGGFALVKLFLLIIGITVVQQTVVTRAELESGCVMIGQYYTGSYETGCVEIPEELTGGYLTGCQIVPGYRTGGVENESGELVDQIRVEETEIGCYLTGQTIIPAYITGCYETGGYLTGGTLLCDEETGENEELGDEEDVISSIFSETEEEQQTICESGDVSLISPVAGNSVRGIFPFSLTYSGCSISGMTLQLLDHNNQWIDIATLSSGENSYAFDSRRLYSFQYSGFYHIIGNTGAGYFYLYTGEYTGSYSRFFTGYAARLLSASGSVVDQRGSFTIDNQSPALTDLALTASGIVTGYVNLSGVVSLSFVASETLNTPTVTIGSGRLPTTSIISGLSYTYTWNMNHLFAQGPLVATITFSDLAGNTGAVVVTSALVFDYTVPTVTGFSFTESDHGLYMNFSSSESVKAIFSYRKSGSDFVSGMNASYLTAQQLDFSGIQRDQLYSYIVNIFDQAGNARTVTGDVTWTNLGQIVSHVMIVPEDDSSDLTGNLATFATTLKEEIEKFNACKDALNYTPIDLEIRRTDFILKMPDFKKSQVKTLVNAFTLSVLDKIKSDYTITKSDIDDLTKKFDNFLVILKLLRDDDNACKQNLSVYHITQFEKALEEYNISL